MTAAFVTRVQHGSDRLGLLACHLGPDRMTGKLHSDVGLLSGLSADAQVGDEFGTLLGFEHAGIAESTGEVRPRLRGNQRVQQGGGAGAKLRMIGTQVRVAF